MDEQSRVATDTVPIVDRRQVAMLTNCPLIEEEFEMRLVSLAFLAQVQHMSQKAEVKSKNKIRVATGQRAPFVPLSIPPRHLPK